MLNQKDIEELMEVEDFHQVTPPTNIGGYHLEESDKKNHYKPTQINNSIKFLEDLEKTQKSIMISDDFSKYSLNGYKVDYLTFTCDNFQQLENILEDLNYNIQDFKKSNGRYFFDSAMTLNNYVTFYFNQFSNKSERCLLVFTGQGCSDLYNRNNEDIQAVLDLIASYKVKVTRLDISYDDYYERLNLDTIEKKIKKGEYISNKRSFSFVSNNKNSTEEERAGKTIYIGNPRQTGSKGGYYIRLYDKYAQSIEKGVVLVGAVSKLKKWNRYEIVYLKEYANNIFYWLVDEKNIDKIYKSSFLSAIRFLTPKKTTTDKYLWNMSKFYKDFIRLDEKMKFISHEKDARFNDLLKWFRKTVLKNIQVLDKALEEHGYNIYDVIKIANELDSNKEFSKKQLRILEDVKTVKTNELEKQLVMYLFEKTTDTKKENLNLKKLKELKKKK